MGGLIDIPICANCNKPIQRKRILHREEWVHVHSGQMYCSPALATPKIETDKTTR